jgi:hypothetical protein
MTTKTSALIPNLRLPDDLTELDQWVLWRSETKNGKPTKVPYQLTGKRAGSTDPRTWSPLAEVSKKLQENRKRYDGIGFVFSLDDGLTGMDVDDCLDEEGGVKSWSRGIVERFGDTYTEISPSGEGLKIWARGSLPRNLPGVTVGDGAIEMYDHARYFAVTGQAFRGAPLQVEDHAEDLLALYDWLTGSRKGWSLQPLPGGRIPYGRQHNTLVSFCGTLRARGACEEAIEAFLQIVNEKQCEQPGSREHVTRIVRSSRRWLKDERAGR